MNAHSAPHPSRWPTDRPLRLLVVLHNLDIGGSQRNSVDLAAGVRDMGHEVVVAGPPGVLEDVIHRRGVRFEAVEELVPDNIAPTARAAYKRIRDLSRRLQPDLIHAYELTPALLAFLGPHRLDDVPMTMTINSMSVPDFMPGTVPLQVCGPLIAMETRERSGPIGVLEIPTDTVGQYPDYPGGDAFRAELGIAPDEIALVVVSRFARALKQEGLETAIRAAGRIAPYHRLRLVMVGDGPAMPELRALADATNARAGREVVLLPGMRVDPRPAYAAADIALGMGGSILRAMAFGKPCIVQGERGYFQMLDRESARLFRWRGFYGIGAGGTGEDALVRELTTLLDDQVRRKENAAFALELVRRHYSLEHALRVQMEWYQKALAEHVRPSRSEVARTVASVGAWFAARAAGRVKPDTFNSSERIAPGIAAPVPDWFDPDIDTDTGSIDIANAKTLKLQAVRRG
ncbi:glycosyltransferase family 4 protein [Pseudonocardia sp. RS11V-5]|uniref:glycosyltransferase family 4 protein n=1 Tax=Pseudonocardia terrae TaxID=2905831 RepID=UPI001E364BDA|nr:glycosyltransferase family 4 protein [Pseudonocardia terrae]MCE3550062.1 glycosyltransferase family 4 protein [Pseudonocardia terrae]